MKGIQANYPGQIEAAAVGLVALKKAGDQKPAVPYLRKTFGLTAAQAVAAIRRADELRLSK